MWCAFDRRIEEARRCLAERFAMTFWARSVTQDEQTGRFWYAVPYVWEGRPTTNRALLCESLRIAAQQQLPMVGILKDDVQKPYRCASRHNFTIDALVDGVDPAVLWLRLSPCAESDLGFDFAVRDVAVARSIEPPATLQALRERFEAAVEAAGTGRDARLERLTRAPRLPVKVEVTTTEFVRNPDVVAEVLHQARGECFYCRKPAPFISRAHRRPYLEVHHRVPLAQGGEDTVENAVAACPNCHREQHHGLPAST